MKRVWHLAVLFVEEFFLLFLGVLAAGFGLKGFLVPNGFIDGGVTGVSLLISHLSGISVSIWIFLLNIPFMILAIKQQGKMFAVKTFVAILGLSIALIFIDYPVITSDKLLVAVFGGFLLGAGIGLAIRGGGVLDGTEVLSIYLGKKISLSIGEIIFLINAVIFTFAGFTLGIEAALYSLLTYLAASKTVDFFIHGIEEFIGITVISDKSKEIRQKLIRDIGIGVTVYRGKSGYDSKEKERDILFSYITRLEVVRVKHEIIDIDPNAVIIEQVIRDVHGGISKKRKLY